VLVLSGEVIAAEVQCRHEGPRWSQTEPADRFGIVLVRSGLFRLEVDGTQTVVDACSGYVQRPGSEQRFAHPAGGDVCTFVSLPESEYEAVTRGAVLTADAPVLTTAGVDVRHRALVARSRAGAQPDELAERAVVLVGSVLAGLLPDAIAAGFVAAGPARRLVDDVRQVLAENPGAPLRELAGAAGLSSYHVSRVFRRTTGVTISAFRSRLRVRRALEQLAGGQRDLARLAAETGFADQAHLTRSVRRETGSTPAQLRTLLAPDRVRNQESLSPYVVPRPHQK
jgi:AraC-like DNA-binding protein